VPIAHLITFVKIIYKSIDEIKLMRAAGEVAASILEEVCAGAVPGVSTWELDQLARKLIQKSRVESAFLHYGPGGLPPYPAVLCTSINSVIVHGIPSKRDVLKDGDIISIDLGIFKNGFCADTAKTVGVGKISQARQRLVKTTMDSLEHAMEICVPGMRIGDIGATVQKFVESAGYSVVEQFVGHGVGRQMHEDPQVPNFGTFGSGKRAKAGLVIAIEPMVNAGTLDVETLDDQWTAVTKDRKDSAHFEHTIAIVEQGIWVLTRPSSTPGHLGTP
jgi:methionyl aminopeptidase